MNKKIGFIGVGNMGSAIVKGLVKSQVVPSSHIFVVDHNLERMERLAQELSIQVLSDVQQLASQVDILIVGVKPKDMAATLENVKAHLSDDTVVVSLAAGVTIAQLESSVTHASKIVRVMPNTPALVGEGMSSITANEQVTAEELEDVKTIFSSLGKAEIVPESLIHAVVAVSGSAPAYVFMFIEAMADAAVLGGMPRDKAYTFAAQAVFGSAKMVLESGMHPAKLKDMVCSPSGTTIEAVSVLENMGLRTAVIEAMKSCMDKSIAMSEA